MPSIVIEYRTGIARIPDSTNSADISVENGGKSMELDYEYLAQLVRKTQNGDSDAFAELYVATYQKQYRFAYHYVNDPEKQILKQVKC